MTYYMILFVIICDIVYGVIYYCCDTTMCEVKFTWFDMKLEAKKHMYT